MKKRFEAINTQIGKAIIFESESFADGTQISKIETGFFGSIEIVSSRINEEDAEDFLKRQAEKELGEDVQIYQI